MATAQTPVTAGSEVGAGTDPTFFHATGVSKLLTFPKLEMNLVQKLHTLWLCALGYLSFCTDIICASNYFSSGNVWWNYLTLVFCFMPGLFMMISQHFTYYITPAETPAAGTVKVGERPSQFKRKEYKWYEYLYLNVLNLFQARLLYEMVRSYWMHFQTGEFLDMKVLQVIFCNVPQTFLQSYIVFREWNASSLTFTFGPTLASLCMAFLNVCFVPNSSPCFEDNRTLTEVKEDEIKDAERRESAREAERQEHARRASLSQVGMKPSNTAASGMTTLP